MKNRIAANHIREIEELKKKKNAIILAHYYQTSDIQDIADFVGDSLILSQKATANNADIILFAGVKFMAETAKILSPEKKILLPDINAGCSLADSCNPVEFKKFIALNPGRTVISYVNTTVDIKALSDIICTSSNVVQIINSFPEDEKFIFAPDKNLGNYVKGLTSRDIVVYDGACHVHEEFSADKILKLKEENPEAKIIVHPECGLAVRSIADYIGSTSGLLSYIKKDKGNTYIIATEPGIIHQMKKACPDKKYIPAPPKDSTCRWKECNFMKLVTVEKILACLKEESTEIILDKKLLKMLENQ